MTSPGGLLYLPWLLCTLAGIVALLAAGISWLPAWWRASVLRQRGVDPAPRLAWLTVPRALSATAATVAVLTLGWTSAVTPITGFVLLLLLVARALRRPRRAI